MTRATYEPANDDEHTGRMVAPNHESEGTSIRARNEAGVSFTLITVGE